MNQLPIRINAFLFMLAGLSAALILYTSPDIQRAMTALVILGIVAGALMIVTHLQLQPLSKLAQQLESLSRGHLQGDELPTGKDEIGRSAQSVNRLRAHLLDIREQLERLARGQIQLNEVEQKVLESKRIEDAKTPTGTSNSDLEKSIIRLDNQLKQLTIQARLLAKDQLLHPVLDERVPGAMGDALHDTLRYLRTLIENSKEVSRGEAAAQEDAPGDLQKALHTTAVGVQTVLGEVKEMTLHMTTSTEEIMAVLQEQTLAASHQASGVEETQRTMETLLSSAKRIAESAQTVFKSAERTQANNRLISDRANELKSHTERISEILETIKTIADRSDLLALNASLEGLRAGEAGKGFTLVAGEMRRLAENIKDSIKDIKGLLSDIRESALSNVMAVEEGSRLSQRTTESALKISLITQQQQSGTEQVTQSMEELSHLINQGLAGTSQVTTAAGDLSELAERIHVLVGTPESAGNTSRIYRPTVRPKRPLTEHSGEIALPRSTPKVISTSTTLQNAIERPPQQNALKVNQPKINPELNATMRFVLGEVQEESTLDLSSQELPNLNPPAKKKTKITDEYEDMDKLFSQMDAGVRPRTKSRVDESIEETFDAIEKDIDAQDTEDT